jgi:hypothetical protein
MIVGKYEQDTLTGLEFFVFPKVRLVVNRVLRTFLVEHGNYKFDSSININTVYLNQDLYDGMLCGDDSLDEDCQLWMRYNLPQYDAPIVRKLHAKQVYVPF